MKGKFEVVRTAIDKRTFSVPLIPPSVNHYVQHTRRGDHYKTDAAKSFAEAVFYLGKPFARDFGPFDQYRVEMTVYFPGRISIDVDNLPKIPLDSLRDAGFYKDDKLVLELEVKKVLESSEPRTEITVIGL